MFDKKIDAYLILSQVNRFYFSGFESSFGCVILTKDKKYLLTDFRYETVAKQKDLGFEVVIVSASGLYETVFKLLSETGGIKSIGYEDEYVSVAEFKRIKDALTGFTLKPASEIITALRAVKTTEQLDNVINAQRIAEKALSKVIPRIKVGVTEREIAAELEYEMMLLGSDGPSFDTVVAFAENTACPHHKTSDKKLEKNDLILIDFGATVNGYHSDMTRTFCLGEPRSELKDMYNVVYDALSYALKFLRAGMTEREADSLAREYIKANGYDKEFGHSLGHGVGLEIHEAPYLRESGDNVLTENMVVTVEPGVYVEGLGGVRLEDTVIITADGNVNITNFDKNINI